MREKSEIFSFKLNLDHLSVECQARVSWQYCPDLEMQLFHIMNRIEKVHSHKFTATLNSFPF